MRTPPHDSPRPSVDSVFGDEVPDPATSLALLSQAQAGHAQALEDLLARYQERILRIVRIQLSSSEMRQQYESMDVLQNTFKAALPRIADLKVESAAALLQWFAVIATNQIRDMHDHMHAAKRDRAREVQIVGDSQVSGTGIVIQAREEKPDDQAVIHELRELLDEEVSRLPEDQRRVVILRDYCGEDWGRISLELGREGGATRQLHQRAWIRLRKSLSPKLEDVSNRAKEEPRGQR